MCVVFVAGLWVLSFRVLIGGVGGGGGCVVCLVIRVGGFWFLVCLYVVFVFFVAFGSVCCVCLVGRVVVCVRLVFVGLLCLNFCDVALFSYCLVFWLNFVIN